MELARIRVHVLNVLYWIVAAGLVLFILLGMQGCGKDPRYKRGDIVEWKLDGQRGMVVDIECMPRSCYYYIRTNPHFQAVRAHEIELEPVKR